LRNLLVIKDPATLQLLLASPSLKEHYKEQSEQIEVPVLFRAIDICNKFDLSYKTSNNKQLHVEIALMQLAQVNTDQAVQVVKKAVSAAPKTVNEPKKIYGKEADKEIPKDEEIKTPEVSQEIKKKEPAVKKEENGRKIKNISIRDGLNALKQKSDDTKEAAEEPITNEFDQSRLIEVWRNFTEVYNATAPSFAHALAKYKPVLKDNFIIEFKVDNILIAKDKINVSAMLEYFKKELNNNQIKLAPVVADKTTHKTAYTDREKFEEMAKKYPDLADLKEQLNLELDF
ncbi:MAG: hypothetical protein DRI72_09830, partial [Bacteroidetes bacterium]